MDNDLIKGAGCFLGINSIVPEKNRKMLFKIV